MCPTVILRRNKFKMTIDKILKEKYDENSIEVLEGLDPVRKRPGMYIGSTGSRGLHHLVYEIMDNAIDESLGGFCDTIKVSINKDGSVTIEDNGRGIPVKKHRTGIPTERVVFTVLHAGGKFNGSSYKVSGGLHGVGASVVNALSKWLEVEIYRNGKIYKDRFEDGGNPVCPLNEAGELESVGETRKKGTKVTFMPDDTIFETLEFKAETIKTRMKETSFLNKGLKLVFNDARTGETVEFLEKEGIVGFVRDITKDSQLLYDSICYIEGKDSDIEVEVAFNFTTDSRENILSFCNNINTVEGGNHVTGFKSIFTRVVNVLAKEAGYLKGKDKNFDGSEIREGINAIILLKHPDPQYEGQTKTKLGSTDAKSAVENVLSLELQKFFERNVEFLKAITDNAMKLRKIRDVELKAREKFLSKDAKLNISTKLAACQTKDPSKSELFIVEGDSAGGSAKQGRDRKFQAILPLKGKILNVEKSSLSKIIANSEVATLINSLGCEVLSDSDHLDIKNLKYHKIVIMTDADVDGSHIRTLLLTFFFRYAPELIHEGYIYIAMPPLYKATVKGKAHYLYTDRDLSEFKLKVKGSKIELQRYKGLGEMNPDQLWNTTLDPKTRYLKQVSIEDAVTANEVTRLLMGDHVQPRRAFIHQEALSANIDI